MKKYKINTYSYFFEEVQIKRETEKTVFFMLRGKERKESKEKYFNTPGEAKAALVTLAARRIETYAAQKDYIDREIAAAQVAIQKLTTP